MSRLPQRCLRADGHLPTQSGCSKGSYPTTMAKALVGGEPLPQRSKPVCSPPARVRGPRLMKIAVLTEASTGDCVEADYLLVAGRHGLVAKSFVPPKPLRELRDLPRYRRELVESQTAERNRLLKLLEGGVRLWIGRLERSRCHGRMSVAITLNSTFSRTYFATSDPLDAPSP